MPTINDRIGSQNIIRVLANASAPPTRINNLIDVVSTKKDETTADGYLLIWDRTTQKYNLGNDIPGGLNVQGITTFISHVDFGEVNFSGVTTAPSFVATESIAMGATTVITAARQLQNIASLDATTTATIEAAVTNAPNTFTDLQITGLSTFLGASRFDSVATFNGGINAPTGVATISSLNIADEITINEGGIDVSGVTSTANLYVTGVSTFYNADVVFQGAAAGQNMTWDASENDLEFSDDARLKFGNSDDLEIWHSGNSAIKNSTGDFKLRSDSLMLKRADDSESYLKATVNKSVEIYYGMGGSSAEKKFETTKEGVLVSGGTTTGTLSVTGVSTFVGESGHVGLATFGGGIDVVAGVTSFREDIQFKGAAYDILWDQATSKFKFNDSAQAVFGSASGGDLKIYHQSGNSTIKNETGQFRIAGNDLRLQSQDSSEDYLLAVDGGSVSIFFNDVKRLETSSSGVNITDTLNVAGVSTFVGVSTFSGDVYVGGDLYLKDDLVLDNITGSSLKISGISTFDGAIDANAGADISGGVGLNVVGHTELDEVNVSGVSTYAGAIDANAGVDISGGVGLNVVGHTELDNLNVSGVSTFAALLDANLGLNVSGGTGFVASTAKISDLTSGRVVYSGASGELQDSANLTFDGTELSVGLIDGGSY